MSLKKGSLTGYLPFAISLLFCLPRRCVDWICSLLRSTKRYVLEDMWHARRVRRIRLEANTEDVVLVVSRHMQIIGAGLVVAEVQRREFEGGNMLGPL